MPAYIIKPRPDEDFYLRWSTIVDAPTAWGTRAELTEALSHYGSEEAAPGRFNRADRSGTSAAGGDWYGWAHTEFAVVGGFDRDGVPDDWRRLIVPRDRLRDFCEASVDGHWSTDPLIGRWEGS